MSKYTKEIVKHQGRDVACYTREDSDFKCYMEPINILEIYPGAREPTLDKLYLQWLAMNNPDNNKSKNK